MDSAEKVRDAEAKELDRLDCVLPRSASGCEPPAGCRAAGTSVGIHGLRRLPGDLEMPTLRQSLGTPSGRGNYCLRANWAAFLRHVWPAADFACRRRSPFASTWRFTRAAPRWFEAFPAEV